MAFCRAVGVFYLNNTLTDVKTFVVLLDLKVI